MPYSRRKLLRDGALSCLAGAVSTSATLIGGCKPHTQEDTHPRSESALKQRSDFGTGIRIFFIGSWLFTPDPDYADNSKVLALSLDLEPTKHKFPYGKYKTNLDAGPFLKVTGSGKPHIVTVDTTSTATINSVFEQAAETQVFMWIPTVKVKPQAELFKITDLANRLMRISVPIPNRIVTADFLNNSSIYDPKGLLHSPVTSITGAPAAFIFDYQNATRLTVDFDPHFSMQGGATSDSDYHFRVVPQDCPQSQHPTTMFKNLLGNLVVWSSGSQEPSLQMTGPEVISPGKNVSYVTQDELDIPDMTQPCQKSMKTAACAGGGGAIGYTP